MRVYKILTFNIKNILFKNTLDYLESCLKENGIRYDSLSSCFTSFAGRVHLRKLFAKYPQFEKYYKVRETILYARHELSSVAADWESRSVSVYNALLIGRRGSNIPGPIRW